MFTFNLTCQQCKQKFTCEAPEVAGDYPVVCPHCSHTTTIHVGESLVKQNQKRKEKSAKKQAQAQTNVAPETVAAKVRRYEIVSNIVWIIIGIIQCITITAAVAGVWNIVNAIIRMRNTKNIVPHNEHVPSYFDERKIWIIVMAIINLVLGGVIGVAISAFDWYVRDYVLKNRDAFET